MDQTKLPGVEIEVTFIDGIMERVLVRKLHRRFYQQYLDLAHDESRVVELYVGRNAQWVDRLTEDSFEMILAKGNALNLANAIEYGKRSIERMRKTAVLLTPLAALRALIDRPESN